MNAGARRWWHLVQLQLAEALHQRIVWILAGGAALVVGAAVVLRDLNFGGAEAHFFISAARVALGLSGTLLVALLGPTLLAQRLASVLFARRVSRAEWVLANLAAVVVTVGWLAVILCAALVALLAWHGHGESIRAAMRALGGGAGALIVLAAAGVFFASVFERPLPTAAATLALALAGQLAPVLDHLRAHSGSVMGAFWRVVDWLVPNLDLVDRAPADVVTVYVVGFAAIYALAAVLVFSRREL